MSQKTFLVISDCKKHTVRTPNVSGLQSPTASPKTPPVAYIFDKNNTNNSAKDRQKNHSGSLLALSVKISHHETDGRNESVIMKPP